MDGRSLDLKQDKIEKMKEVIPEAFTEGRTGDDMLVITPKPSDSHCEKNECT